MATSVSWARLVDIIGKNEATALCTCYGGVDLYVPQDHHKGELPKIIGLDAAEALSANFGGEYIVLPNEVHKYQPKKAEIIRLLEQGTSARQVALQCKVTISWVMLLKKRLALRRERRPRLPIR